MNTKELQKEKMKQKGITRKDICEYTGACDKTIGQYIRGKTTSGPYLTFILEILDITVEEWNQCINVINDKDGRKCEWENIKK